MGMPPGGVGKMVAFGTPIGWVSSFSNSHFAHDEHRLADVGVLGPLHTYRGLGDFVQEAAHLVGDDPFV